MAPSSFRQPDETSPEASPSKSRPPRATQPIAGARSPRTKRPSACPNAQRAAPSASPRRNHAWWAAIQASSHASSLPDHVGSNRKTLEILDLQLPLAMSRRQFGERATPRPTRERAASSLNWVNHGQRSTICPDAGADTAIAVQGDSPQRGRDRDLEEARSSTLQRSSLFCHFRA
jgi:hypothetical protein